MKGPKMKRRRGRSFERHDSAQQTQLSAPRGWPAVPDDRRARRHTRTILRTCRDASHGWDHDSLARRALLPLIGRAVVSVGGLDSRRRLHLWVEL